MNQYKSVIIEKRYTIAILIENICGDAYWQDTTPVYTR